MNATFHVYAENCVQQGQEVSTSDFESRPDSDDFCEIEISKEEAEFYAAKKSTFGWRVARQIREKLGVKEGVDQFGNVAAIDEALRQYRTTDANPCGGCGYYDDGEENPYRVHFADGGSDENFATLEEAVQAARDYADEMDAENNV